MQDARRAVAEDASIIILYVYGSFMGFNSHAHDTRLF